MKKRNKIIISISILTIVLLVSVGLTYAAFTYNRSGETSELVLGDIYMHYKEKDKSINIDDMMPLEEYTLNTSDEKVDLCVKYLMNKYGHSWNGLESPIPASNDTNEITGSFMIALPDYFKPTYREYCSNNYINQEYFNNKILIDYADEVFTSDDKEYFEANGIITDNIKNLNYFEFDITGKNTNTKGNVAYNIAITHGDEPTIEEENEETTLERITDNFIRFRLVEVIDDEETILVNNKSYGTINNTTIYSNIISKNTNEEIGYTYRLYMWIDESVVIGNTIDANYTMEEWSNLFASIKVNVNGKYQEGEVLTEKIKNKLGTEGLVAVNTEGNLYDGTGTIREYRYAGMGNYCTYTDGENDYNLNIEGDTCPQTACSINNNMFIINGNSEGFLLYGSCTEQGGTELSLKTNEVHDAGLRNYIEIDGEMWRILGVFGDNVKVIKDTPLANEIYTEETYTSGDTTYTLKSITTGSKYGYFYYNFPHFEYESNLSDWTTSGVMHYLNDETGNSYYVNKIAKLENIIEEGTYYLGNVGENMDSASAIYNDEINSNNIHGGNKATWSGYVGLLQMSDFIYSHDASAWNVEYGSNPSLIRTSWLGNSESLGYWFISPFYYSADRVWFLLYGSMANMSQFDNIMALRPTLNLKSNVIVISGDGSYNNPYKLLEN